MLVTAIDAGSAKNFGWAVAGQVVEHSGPESLVELLKVSLRRAVPVALGVEAPLWIPAGRAFGHMTASRGGIEQALGRAWSAGAGCGALGAGLANLTWLLEQLATDPGALNVTTCPERFAAGEATLLIWEAFVSGDQKQTEDHHGDAVLAADAFGQHWPNLQTLIPGDAKAVNLVVAVVLATGHRIDPSEAGQALPVIGPARAGAAHAL